VIKKCFHNLGRIMNRTVVVAGGLALTLIFFIILPLMQRIGAPEPSWSVRTIETAPYQPPPPDIVVEERSGDVAQDVKALLESPPPEFQPSDQLLDPGPMDMALDDLGFGTYEEGRMLVDLDGLEGLDSGGSLEVEPRLFAVAELDEKPRVLRQDEPDVTSDDLKRRMPGRVQVIFVVDEQGRVREAGVQQSTDPIFERPALEAVARWRFEPGKIKGKPVACRVSIWIGFSR